MNLCKKITFYLILPLCLTFFQSAMAINNNFFEKLKKGSEKDYLVTEQDGIYSALILSQITEKYVVFEEISIPKNRFKKLNSNWKDWLENGCRGASSWIFYQIDLEKKRLSCCYSFLNKAWINISNEQALLAKLLFLPFHQVDEKERKKIGPPPLDDGQDHRSYWYPPLVLDGKKSRETKWRVYQIKWPKDKTELSEKTMDLYFHENLPFPYFVQVNTSHLSIILKAVDSGKSLENPRNRFIFTEKK